MPSLKKTIKIAIRNTMAPACERVCEVMKFAPPGHFYSPIPSVDDYHWVHSSNNLEAHTNSSEGIDFNEEGQLKLLDEISKFHSSLPDFPYNKTSQYNFYYDNDYYSFPDASVFFCLVNYLKPQKIIDVGGGNTTTLMMDCNKHCFKDNPIDITVIEPYPDRMAHLVSHDSTVKKLFMRVQDCDLSLFESLKKDDILFLDTTHVSKLGSDVNYLAFNVFPRLQSGVVIHIHEMFYPFEYPKEFFDTGKCWNELYFWRAFLSHNDKYEILLHNSYLAKKFPELLRSKIPNYFKTGRKLVNVQNEGSSLWLRKR